MEINFNDGSQIKTIKCEEGTRGNSRNRWWFNPRYYVDFLLMNGFKLEELNELSSGEIERLAEKIAEPFIKAMEINLGDD